MKSSSCFTTNLSTTRLKSNISFPLISLRSIISPFLKILTKPCFLSISILSFDFSFVDDSIGDMEGCDISLEGILKQNYNHISHRIIDKRWDDEIQDWNYLPKGDQNALHDGCFITSKDIKYKLEMLIKIKN